MKIKILLITATLLMLTNALAESKNLDVRCTTKVMDVNGVMKDVKVLIYTDRTINPSRHELSITTKPANSPHRRSNPIPNDPISYNGYISIKSSNNSEYKLTTDDRKNGYNIIAEGELFSSTTNSSCSSFVTLNLESIGNPTLKINDQFDCSSVCDW